MYLFYNQFSKQFFIKSGCALEILLVCQSRYYFSFTINLEIKILNNYLFVGENVYHIGYVLSEIYRMRITL